MSRKRTKADDVVPAGEGESPTADLQRPPAEVLFAGDLSRLAEEDAGKPRPKGWRLTPQSVVRFVLGDGNSVHNFQSGRASRNHAGRFQKAPPGRARLRRFRGGRMRGAFGRFIWHHCSCARF